MPIKIPDNLPAKDILIKEEIFAMDESRAYHQDIRPLRIAIFNLMPTKQTTEVQLLRLLGNTSLQIDVKLLHMESHISKNTSLKYLETFYNVFEDIKDRKFDGMIITGAPIEQMPFENVGYWKELVSIMDWSTHNVTSTLHICWGAQAGLYHRYCIPKYPLEDKMFGSFLHKRLKPDCKLLRGFDDVFYAPHSRHTEIRREDIEKVKELQILSESEEAGIYIVADNHYRNIFVTGHSEYDPATLKEEYLRDVQKGEKITLPKNYFPGDDHNKEPIVTWRSHANLLFSNWLNYCVYQETPYELG